MCIRDRLSDGRFHILLQGVARAELQAELPPAGQLYRRALASLLVPQDEGEEAAREVQALRVCYARLLEMNPDHRDLLGDLPLRIQEPRILADVVCAAVLTDPEQRQRALEEPSVALCLRWAHDAVATLLLEGFSAEPGPVQ